MVYLDYHCNEYVVSRKQVAPRMDSKPMQPSTMGDTDDSLKAMGSVTSKHTTHNHLHKKSIKVAKGCEK
jgi:hypothetical protein